MATGTMVEVQNLSKQFKRTTGDTFMAVKDVSFSIRSGEIYSLLGPNGAGKSTTINMISGLLTPTGGDALIGGTSITRQPLVAKRMLGVVPQELAVYPDLTARQNLEFFGKMYSLRGDELARRVDAVLDIIDLTDRAKDKVKSFSGGMKRRVNIGIGLLHNPRLIYMDEPTVGIDPQNRRRILDTVRRMRDEFGMTVLYTSHLMEEVQQLSDRVAIIDHGQIIAEGTVSELIQRVGEMDRLAFNVGASVVPPTLIEHVRTTVPGVSHAEYLPASQMPNGTTVQGAEESAADHADYGRLIVTASRGRRALPDIIRLANEAGVEVQSVEVREPDLEAVFLSMTGRALRD